MKYIKSLLFVAVAMVLLFLVVGIFMPSQFSIERSNIIHLPIDSISNNIEDLDYFKEWIIWHNGDSASFKQFGKVSGQSIIWDDEKIGKGTLSTIKNSIKNTFEQVVELEKPINLKFNIKYLLAENDKQTTLTWKAYGDLSYPINRFYKVPIEAKLNKLMISSLAKLKKMSSIEMGNDTLNNSQTN